MFRVHCDAPSLQRAHDLLHGLSDYLDVIVSMLHCGKVMMLLADLDTSGTHGPSFR